jgi:hypothetical protein
MTTGSPGAGLHALNPARNARSARRLVARMRAHSSSASRVTSVDASPIMRPVAPRSPSYTRSVWVRTASLRSTYRAQVSAIVRQIWLDAPVSNSGRLRARLLERMADLDRPVDVDLVPDADRVLVGLERVVSSDAAVIDACASWINLASWIVSNHVPGAWIVPLDRRASS